MHDWHKFTYWVTILFNENLRNPHVLLATEESW
jgi:hypothetical protein